jgi:hypothetical protein
MFGNAYFGATYYGDAYFGQGSGVQPPVVLVVPDGARRPRKPKRARDPYALAREYNRARAVADAQLEQDIAPQHAPAQTPTPQPEQAEAAATAPLLTDALARAASAQQLMTIMRSASAAVLDRQRAAEERRRRGLMAVLMLALD